MYAEINNNKVSGLDCYESEGSVEVDKSVQIGDIYDPIEKTFSREDIVVSAPTKEELLNSLIVTTTTGKRFYADPESRTDLMAVVLEGQILNAPDETVLEDEWKTAEGWKAVTLGEIREASKLALAAKGQIIK